jgi:hypothetical protein
MFYLVLIELNERKILIWVFIPHSLEVPVLQLRATNKLRSGCRPNGPHSIEICAPVIVEPRSVQFKNSANCAADNERISCTRANEDRPNHSNAQFPTVVVGNVVPLLHRIAIFPKAGSFVEHMDEKCRLN